MSSVTIRADHGGVTVDITVSTLGTVPDDYGVVLDRALTQRLIDPFTTSDVRGVVVKSLAALAKEGRVVKQGAGLYQARPD